MHIWKLAQLINQVSAALNSVELEHLQCAEKANPEQEKSNFAHCRNRTVCVRIQIALWAWVEPRGL